MKIAIIGATGYVGADILHEALDRDHQVTALVRHPEKLSYHKHLTSHKVDIFDEAKLAQLMVHHDAVISAFNSFKENVSEEEAAQLQLKGTKAIIHATKAAKLERLLMVGGAGSLEVAPQLQLVDTPSFPKEYKFMAQAMREALEILQAESNLNWTFLSPSALLVPGIRTGKFRLGKNQLLVNDQDESKISTQDYAVAMIDELEQPKHLRQRFTVGY